MEHQRLSFLTMGRNTVVHCSSPLPWSMGLLKSQVAPDTPRQTARRSGRWPQLKDCGKEEVTKQKLYRHIGLHRWRVTTPQHNFLWEDKFAPTYHNIQQLSVLSGRTSRASEGLRSRRRRTNNAVTTCVTEFAPCHNCSQVRTCG